MLTSRHLGAITDAHTATTLGEVRVDLDLDDPAAVTEATIDEVDHSIDALDTLRATALASFTAALGDDDSPHDQVAKFWEFHHDEVDPTLERDHFVAALQLARAGFYPDGDVFVILDFAVRGPQTDQLLVANFKRDRSLDHVSWES